MPDNAIEPARERLAEQIMSDERLLGALPENAAQLVLDHALARLDTAAARATSVEELEAEAESIRAAAWNVTEQAASAPDPEQAVRALFAGEVSVATGADAELTGVASGHSPEVEATGEPAPTATPEYAPAPDEQALSLPDDAPYGNEPPVEPPSLWERVRGLWRGFGRDG